MSLKYTQCDILVMAATFFFEFRVCLPDVKFTSRGVSGRAKKRSG